MADLKPNAQEDKDVEPDSDSSDPTQEPLHSRTSSLKNHAAGLSEQLSSDAHQNLLNGVQPNPFVCSRVPAVPHAGNSLPLGALVNGPGSHSTSEESCVLNKGSILPNNVLDTTRQPEEATGPQVLPPPIVLQSDARRSSAGALLITLPAQPGVAPPPSDTDKREAELLLAPLPGRAPDQTRVSQISTNKRKDAGSVWELDSESSESSSDDLDGEEEDANWNPQNELLRFLWNGHAANRGLDTNSGSPRYVSQRRRKRSIHAPACRRKERHYCGNDDADARVDANEEDSDAEDGHCFNSETLSSCRGRDKDNHGERRDDFCSAAAKKLKNEPSEQKPPCFPFAKRSVHIKEQRHLHRRMIYHLNVHKQVRRAEIAPRPFICRECGRSFRDPASLSKHMIIHQERREKLMKEIKGQRPDEGGDITLRCPQCVFSTNCPNAFVQHAKTHGERGGGRHSCDECSDETLTEQGLEAHMHKVHFKTQSSSFLSDGEDSKAPMFQVDCGAALFHCKLCSFTSHNENNLRMHSRLIHNETSDQEDESSLSSKVLNCKELTCNKDKVADLPGNADLKPLQLKPKFCTKKTALWKAADLSLWTSSKADSHIRNLETEDLHRGLDSSQFKHGPPSSTNKLSQSLQRSDKRGKLSLQPLANIDVTTGLPFVEEDNQEKGHEDVTERTKYPPNMDVLLTSKTGKSHQIFCHGYNSDSRHGDCDLASRNVEEQAVFQKSLSKRKMSTPLRNAIDSRVDDALPRIHQRSKGNGAPVDQEGDDEDTYDFSDYTGEATAHFLDSSENEKNPYARSYFIRRQRLSAPEDTASTSDPFDRTDREDDDCSDIQQLIIKEECIESAVCDDFTPSQTAAPPRSDPSALPASLGTDPKSCPYCPATFESGVGLSNHVRGHLHRVGLSYDARHMISPEQVATQDCKSHIRRKVPSLSRRVKKADKPESQGEHTCPLCWGWFDTKTGLSNHVRGHLKRIGRTISSTSKSPLSILNELLRNEKEHQNVLQLMNRKESLSRPFVSQKFIGSDGLFLTSAGVPVKIQHGGRTNAPWRVGSPKEEELSDKAAESQALEGVESQALEGVESQALEGAESQALEGAESSSSTLAELLRRRKVLELETRDGFRKHLTMTKENAERTKGTGVEPSWARDGPEYSRKMCVHCSTIFPSAVSLSNHLRAYARRKRVAMIEGTSYDCKQKKLRSRPGLKKKVFPLSNAVEQIYRLTCRFCDLVFQGPLSVQEDWIKHLQRHLMNTAVPHTGTGMVEILGLHQEISPSTTDEPVPEQHMLALGLPLAS